MNEWVPLHGHSHYSLLDGLAKPEQIAKRCKELGLKACALTDHGSISGSIQFIKHLKKAGVKPILGSEFYLCSQEPTIKEASNRSLTHLCVLAKNLDGWNRLIQATSAANKPEHIYYGKPRLQLEQLAKFAEGQFIVFSGHPGSDLGNCIFQDYRAAYSARTYEAAKACAYPWPDLQKRVLDLIGQYCDLFGRENVRLEIQLMDARNMPAAQIIAKVLRWASKKTGVPCIATGDAHYARPEDAEDQRVVLCGAFETTMRRVETNIANNDDVTLGAFFRSNRFYIQSADEVAEFHEPDELKNTLAVAEMCETYDVLGQPKLPVFDCPDGLSADAYLKKLASAGWLKQIAPRIENGKVVNWDGEAFDLDLYKSRIKHELEVIGGAGLSGYFLIVQDYVNWAINQGWLVGPGRGSGAGCLVSYLLGITGVDPIPPDLLFERFYNHGRNQPGKVSLPDIDVDFPIAKREKIFEYLQGKYGHDRVCQMVAFQTLKGREALKMVLRVHEEGDHDEWNRITKNIPQDSAISDDLQEMLEETGESSIIQWALENNAKELREWCWIGDDGQYEGPLARRFAQAKRLEGTKKADGRHPSGVVIAPEPIANLCPMLYDKNTGQTKAGLEMGDLESMGIPKFDVLGVAAIDKLMMVRDLMRTGKIS